MSALAVTDAEVVLSSSADVHEFLAANADLRMLAGDEQEQNDWGDAHHIPVCTSSRE